MKKKVKVFLGAAIAVVVVGGIVSGFLRKKTVVEYETRPSVTVENPVIGDVTLYTELVGTIEPQSKATVLPKISGQVLEVDFQAGDQVQAGQVLCRLDSDVLTSLRLQVEAAEVSLNDAKTSLSRTQALYAADAVSHQALEQAESGVKGAQISYDSAKNQYDLQLEYTTITAPISGTIESRGIEVNDHINTSTEICVISGEAAMQVQFGITETTLENLSVNDKVEVEKNGKEYEGIVTEIGTMVNSSTGLYDAKAAIPQTAGLTNGSKVKLTVVMNSAEQVLTIPVDAVSYDGGVPYVYSYEDGAAHKVVIEAGIYDADRMEVISGLTEDMQIITSWSNELVDQQEVLLYEEQAENTVEEDGQVS